MLPIDFEGSNLTLTPPVGVEEEDCQSMRAWYGPDDNGHHHFMTMWQPNREDLEALNAGRPIIMKTYGPFAPMALFTMDENDQPNF